MEAFSRDPRKCSLVSTTIAKTMGETCSRYLSETEFQPEGDAAANISSVETGAANVLDAFQDTMSENTDSNVVLLLVLVSTLIMTLLQAYKPEHKSSTCTRKWLQLLQR